MRIKNCKISFSQISRSMRINKLDRKGSMLKVMVKERNGVKTSRLFFVTGNNQDELEDWSEDWLTRRKLHFIYAQLHPD